jgi:hypothetical protein
LPSALSSVTNDTHIIDNSNTCNFQEDMLIWVQYFYPLQSAALTFKHISSKLIPQTGQRETEKLV